MGRKKKIKFQSLPGMHDILFRDQRYFRKIKKTVRKVAGFYGFREITTPIIENVDLFSRGIGESTDIVKKEMYILKTRGNSLALRPEGTAPIVRAYIQHGMQSLPQPVKLWYFGPFFRHERHQAGRYRQFWQTGLEVLGDESPIVDAQIIQISHIILKKLGFKDLVIEINNIGCSQCRPYYKKILKNYLKSHRPSLCGDCKSRFKENPFRILDCKNEKCKEIVNSAPQIIDHLCKECHNHFKEVLEFLDDLKLPYHLNPYLVRGLDYYTKTVFEILPAGEDGLPLSEEGAHEEVKKYNRNIPESLFKNALGGGGRYDKLADLLGGQDIPACGVAIGVERIIELMRVKGVKLYKKKEPKIFLAQLGKRAKKESLMLMEDFRKEKISAVTAFNKNSLREQLKVADKLRVKYSLILGQKEVIDREILIRDMKTGKQEAIAIDEIVKEIKKRI